MLLKLTEDAECTRGKNELAGLLQRYNLHIYFGDVLSVYAKGCRLAIDYSASDILHILLFGNGRVLSLCPITMTWML